MLTPILATSIATIWHWITTRLSFGTVQHWITTRGFYGGVATMFLLLIACGLGLPLPEDIPLIIAGAFLCTDVHRTVIVAIAAWFGILGGDTVLYMMAKHFGLEVTRIPFIGKHVTRERIENVRVKFHKYGVGVVAIGRMFAGLRGAMVICAGAIRFNFVKFIIADGLAAIVSGGMFLLLGHWIGVQLNDPAAQRKIHDFKEWFFAAALVVLIAVAIFIWWRHRNVEKLHDAEEKMMTRVVSAEKKVTDTLVHTAGKIVKKPTAQQRVDSSLTARRDRHIVQNDPINSGRSISMPVEVKPLGFANNALEPHIDAKTMEIHHDKHYAAYVNNYNDAVKKQPELEGKPLHAVLANQCAMVKEEIKTTVRNNGGGAHNHALFWEILNPAGKSGAEPTGKLAEAINKDFGSFAAFKEKFETAAKTRFGSGWAWLVKKGAKLEVISTANQDSPLMDGAFPVIGLDVWEHAYYLKYQNKRPDYVSAWWNVVNWKVADDRFGRAQ